MNNIVTEIVRKNIISENISDSEFSNVIPYRIPHYIPYDNSSALSLITTSNVRKTIKTEIV